MKKATLFAFIFLSSFSKSFCQDIYTYISASTAGAPSFVDPNIATASSLTAIGTGTITPCTDGFSGIDGFTGSAYSSSGPCIQISLTAAAGYTITATGFMAHLRNSTTGPTEVRFAYSADGGTTWIDDGIDYSPLSGACATDISGTNLASWTPFSVTNTSLLFRIYPFAASGASGTIQVFDLDITGNVHPLCTTLPSVTVSPSVSNICTGGSGAVLTASGAGAGGTYRWSPATGLSASTGASVTAAPGSTRVYTVTGATSVGCANTATATVSMNPLPAISVSPALNTICSGSNVVLTASGAGAGGSYAWLPVTGLSPASGAAVTAAPGASTVYTVTGATSAGCANIAIATVSVNPLPAASVSVTGAAAFCPGGSALLTANAGAGYTYQWYNGIAAIPGATGITYTASGAGNYKVAVTNTSGCTAASAPVVITVSVPPAAVITISGAASFCSGRSVALSAPAGAGYSYQWYQGGAVIPGATALSYTDTGTGFFTVKVTNASGCSNSSAATLLTAVALPSLVTGGPVTFCAGNSVMLHINTGAAATGISYQWQRAGTVIAGATNATYTGNTTGDYDCIVNIGGSCTDTTAAAHVLVHAAPNPAISFNGTLLSTSSGYISYQWYVNSISIPGATTYFTTPIAVIANGNYDVRVTDNNGCSGSSAAYPVITHGLEVGSVNNAAIKIYPNPAGAVIHIQSPVRVRAIITAMEGKIVTDQTDARDIDISLLSAGLYLINLYNDSGERVMAGKFVKQ